MRKERINLELCTIKRNDGQLEWLPRNPRQWTQTDIDNTARSIAEDEDFLEDRPLLVVPNGDEYIVFAGNLRREGAKKQKMKTVPAVVYYPETDEDRLTVKRRAMKDNGSFGAWDYDALANEWDDLPLQDWGVPSWNPDEDKDGGVKVDEGYSTKVNIPQYEPTGKIPAFAEMYDTSKTEELVSAIEAAHVPEDVKIFLIEAAHRHTKFNYKNIAEFYANATPEVQQLMEDSALVIIDIEDAIAKGYTMLSGELEELREASE